MGILHSFALELESFVDRLRLPDVRAACPTSCPYCGNPTYPPGAALGVIGHGTYQRQVLGLGQGFVIHVRRYLCKACRRTFAVLPDDLIPRRWYAAAAILAVLVGHLVLGATAAALNAAHGPGATQQGWRTPARWARQLCAPLWAHRAGEVFHRPGLHPGEVLQRLLARVGAHARSPTTELEIAARALGVGTPAC